MSMRSALRCLAAIGLLTWSAAAAAATSGTDLAAAAGRGLIGTPAPRLVLKTIDGDTIDLGDLYGKKAVYLKFWATWCTPCREQMPHLEHTYQSAGADLAVIAIDVGFGDSVEAIRAYRRQAGITMPIVFDEDGHLGAAFNLRVTPQHVVIGRDGRIQYLGHLADRRLDAALAAARESNGALARATEVAVRTANDAPHFGVGDALPAQSVRLLDGREFAFRPRTAAAARPTVFVFLSPWCESYLATTRPVVSASCRRTREQVESHVHDRSARWLGVASGLWATPEDLRKYRKRYEVKLPLTLDAAGALFREFRVNNVPTVIVCDAKGQILQRIEPSDAQALQQALERL